MCVCLWETERYYFPSTPPSFWTHRHFQLNRSAQCSKPSRFLHVSWREANNWRDRSFWCPRWEGGYRLHVPAKTCQRSYRRGQNTPAPAYILFIAWAILGTRGASQKTQCNSKSIFINLRANRATYWLCSQQVTFLKTLSGKKRKKFLKQIVLRVTASSYVCFRTDWSSGTSLFWFYSYLCDINWCLLARHQISPYLATFPWIKTPTNHFALNKIQSQVSRIDLWMRLLD